MMNFETSKRPRWDRSCVWPNLKGWLVLFQTFLELLLVILLSFNFFYYNISFRAAPLIQWKSHLDKACYIPITPSSHLYSPPHTLSLSSHCSFLATANIPTWLNLGNNCLSWTSSISGQMFCCFMILCRIFTSSTAFWIGWIDR